MVNTILPSLSLAPLYPPQRFFPVASVLKEGSISPTILSLLDSLLLLEQRRGLSLAEILHVSLYLDRLSLHKHRSFIHPPSRIAILNRHVSMFATFLLILLLILNLELQRESRILSISDVQLLTKWCSAWKVVGWIIVCLLRLLFQLESLYSLIRFLPDSNSPFCSRQH